MDCCTPELLAAFYDGDLNAKRMQSVQDHLLGCEKCCYEIQILHEVLKKQCDAPKVVLESINRSYRPSQFIGQDLTEQTQTPQVRK